MNPLTNMKNVIKLSEQELYTNNRTSWHDQYRDSAWVFIGGLPYDLSEGDIVCIFSQYGEVVNINLIRDKDNGKSKGFCFLCYEDQRSTVLAVDNFNGIKVLNRILRVDHVSNYKIPKQGEKTDDVTKKLYSEGCAPKPVVHKPVVKLESQCLRETLADQIQAEIKLPERLPIYPIKKEPEEGIEEDGIKQEIEEKAGKISVRNSKPEPNSESENERQNQKKSSEKRKHSESNTEAKKYEIKKKYFKTNEEPGSSRKVKDKFLKKLRIEEKNKKSSKSLRPCSPNDRKTGPSDRKKNYSHETHRQRRRSRSRSREYRK